jgi:hypothetical protein
MRTIRCTFSVDDRGEDVLARVAIDGGPSYDVIRPIHLSAEATIDEVSIVYEVVEDSSHEDGGYRHPFGLPDHT